MENTLSHYWQMFAIAKDKSKNPEVRHHAAKMLNENIPHLEERANYDENIDLDELYDLMDRLNALNDQLDREALQRKQEPPSKSGRTGDELGDVETEDDSETEDIN